MQNSTPHKSFITLLLIFSTLTLTTPKLNPPIIDQQIGQSIFHQNALYMIYVCNQSDNNLEQIFNEYCAEKNRLCTVLSPEVDLYAHFREFIGGKQEKYFAILDVKRRKKYVLETIEGLTVNDLRIFQSKFQQGILQPFYASQQPDKQTYYKCQKLVSKTLNNFFKKQAQIKVIFLYTQHSACQVCGEMLRGYADLAQKIYEKQIVIFGYYDIFKNDHPKITDQILPYFLIYTKDVEEPYGLAGEKFDQLQETIIQLALKNTDIDLEKFRRQHKLNLGMGMSKEELREQYQMEYKYKLEEQEQEGQKLNVEEL